jgi:hypothetical protein
MTVAVSDGRYSRRLTDIRKEIYGKDFPASTLLTVAAFAVPEIIVEITPSRCWRHSRHATSNAPEMICGDYCGVDAIDLAAPSGAAAPLRRCSSAAASARALEIASFPCAIVRSPRSTCRAIAMRLAISASRISG